MNWKWYERDKRRITCSHAAYDAPDKREALRDSCRPHREWWVHERRSRRARRRAGAVCRGNRRYRARRRTEVRNKQIDGTYGGDETKRYIWTIK